MKPEPIWRCGICRSQVFDEVAHRPHDEDCVDDSFCRCERPVRCPLCCESCRREVTVLPGQVSLLGDDAA